MPRPGRGDPAPRIEKALLTHLGVSSRVTVLTAAELAAALTENPLISRVGNPPRFLVTILAKPADRARLEPLALQDWAPEALAIGTRVAYLWCAQGILASRLPEAVGRVLGDAATSRNWATMTKLLALAGSSP